ncbi:MAG: lytic transglycosylase domain-containing protein [Solirubrobacteraceae bacterium]
MSARRIAVACALAAAAFAGLVVLGAGALLLGVASLASHATLPIDVAGAAPSAATSPAPSPEALGDIPQRYLKLYRAAAVRYDLDWTVLAGIGRVECDHGRDPAPSCTVEGQLNYAGAGGPAQFLVSTWREYGVTASGHGTPDMWNPSDAIFSMARYLNAAGAPSNYRAAIFAYNHAWWYVDEVLEWARRYRAQYG